MAQWSVVTGGVLDGWSITAHRAKSSEQKAVNRGRHWGWACRNRPTPSDRI